MSHCIFVRMKRDGLGGVFRKATPALEAVCAVPGICWPEGPASLPETEEVMVAREGSARGVSLRSDGDGVIVRLFTCSSRVDVDLGLDICAALMRAGSGDARNEDDEAFATVDELFDHYDDDFREAYVEWGPNALAQQVPEENGASLGGPWSDNRFDGRKLAQAYAMAPDASTFAEYLLTEMVETQTAARAAKEAIEQRNATAMAALPSAVFANAWLLLGALDKAKAADGDGSVLTTSLKDAAAKHAASSVAIARALADAALKAATSGDFAESLELFDIVVSLPPLGLDPVMVQETLTTKQGAQRSVSEQSSWACNATWAVQADNNGFAVDEPRARIYIDRCLPFAPQNPAIYANCACIAFELGERDRALSFIALAARHGYENLDALAKEPLLAPLSSDARFQSALAGTLQA